MTAALVAKGPRHVLLPSRRDECSTVLAVNHAIAWHSADWWVFGDMETHDATCPIGRPRWCLPKYAAWRLRKRGIVTPGDAIWWDDFGLPETMFSAVAALHLAKHLGATSVLCFGVVDEHAQPDEAARWARERAVWNETIERLSLSVERA